MRELGIIGLSCFF